MKQKQSQKKKELCGTQDKKTFIPKHILWKHNSLVMFYTQGMQADVPVFHFHSYLVPLDAVEDVEA